MARAQTKHQIEISPAASRRQIDLAIGALGQLSRLTRPKFYGIEKVTDPRLMLVGNHTIYGVFDIPFMVAEVYRRNGLMIRSLGDHRHWAVPGWGQFLEGLGAVRGTREITSELMRRGEPILVFPGGAREVNKRRGEKYELFWKNRLGFAGLAIEHGYPIVPFAAVGGEEMLDVVLDEHNPIYGRFADVARKTVGWPLPTLARGIGLTPIPRPQRLYFWFGDPVQTKPYAGRGAEGAREVRDLVKQEVETGIEFLLAERAQDPERHLIRRLLAHSDAE